jgi:glycosyltransferase involved in cell wall biosynthesis
MDYLAHELGVRPALVRAMGRDPGVGDAMALGALVRLLRAEQPHIVHTHTAMAGTLGRLAALLAYPRRRDRPLLVHTFHGHSLTGYFGERRAALYRGIERVLARRTDALVAVSAQVADELAELGVAARERLTVVPLGFDLAPFTEDAHSAAARGRVRAELGIPPKAELVTLVARLVPIKRVDRFLRVARLLAEKRPRTRFLIVGGGELQDSLQGSADARALAGKLVWAGFRREMAEVYFASDVVVLTSDNEGTPVSLIEAQAAAVPVVGTNVGGTRNALRHGETGLLAPPQEAGAIAEAIVRILDDRELAARLGQAGRRHALAQFGISRLVDDIDRLYRGLLRR